MNQSSSAWAVRLQNLFRTMYQNPIAQRTGIALMILLFAVLFVQGYGKILRPEGNDFTSYLKGSIHLLQGENIYQLDLNYPALYPLFLPLAVSPLTALPMPLAYIIWYGCSVATLLISIRMLLLPVSLPKPETYSVLTFLLLLVYIPILQNNILNGQVNCFVLFFSVFFLHFFHFNDRWKPSIFLGMAVSLKIVPVLFFLFLLLRKCWSHTLGTLLSAVLFFLLPIFFLGDEIFASYYDLFVRKVAPWLIEVSLEQEFERHFSLYGFLSTIGPGVFDVVWVKWLSMSFVGVLLLIIETLQGGTKQYWWTFSMYWLAILLISPLSETHHLLYTIPAFALLLRRGVLSPNSPTPMVWFGLFGFVIAFYIGHFTDLNAFLFLAIVILFVANVSMLFSPVETHD